MSKHRIILFCPERPECPYHDRIFNDDFEFLIASTEEEFLTYKHNVLADVAVLCFCSAHEEDVENLLRLDAVTGPIPVLTCSRTLNPEFIRKAAQRGADRFLVCDMPVEKIRDIIHDAIRDTGLREFLESRWPDSLNSSLYITKLIDEIMHVFPHRMMVEEYAERLGIDRGWLHKLCKAAFDRPLIALLRQIWVHQALRMMQHTNLNNLDIAMQLDYSEESSMARDFHKELGICPNEARIRLTEQGPEEILN